MKDDDKKQFKIILDLMCDGLNLSRFNKETLLNWFNGLVDYTIQEVSEKIDHYIEINKAMPTLEIIQKHEVTIRPKTVTPLTVENNKAHMKEVKELTSKKGGNNNLNWAHKLLARPNITDFQRNFANKALGIK